TRAAGDEHVLDTILETERAFIEIFNCDAKGVHAARRRICRLATVQRIRNRVLKLARNWKLLGAEITDGEIHDLVALQHHRADLAGNLQDRRTVERVREFREAICHAVQDARKSRATEGIRVIHVTLFLTSVWYARCFLSAHETATE